MSTESKAEDAPNPERRAMLARATAALGGLAIAGAGYPFIRSLGPSELAKAAGAPVDVDLTHLSMGALQTVQWRGKPVWVLRRTKEMLATLESDRRDLSDPDSRVQTQQPEFARNEWRAMRPELFVTVALCTHLGCVPTFMPEPGSVQRDWPGGFYCPCHGSKFDLAGRVFKGSPAPTNLEIPPYRYAGEALIVIGEESSKAA